MDPVLHPITERLDEDIAAVVLLLRSQSIDTFTSCQGGEGHAFDVPTVRIKPADPMNMQPDLDRIAQVLADAGYGGYYLKQVHAYQDEPRPWQPEAQSFIELEFWLYGDGNKTA